MCPLNAEVISYKLKGIGGRDGLEMPLKVGIIDAGMVT